jgi:serine/threonine-protein kinase
MMHHVTTTPEPPSRRTELAVPPDLERLVLRCLEKDPGNRPASAEALMAAWDAVPLAGAWTGERARVWWERHAPAPLTSGVHDLSPAPS